MTSLRFYAVDEPLLSRHVRAAFVRRWPVYRAWFLRDGDAARPDGRTCRMMIGHHMPELLPIYDRLLTCVDANEEQARFLSLWCPPNFMHGCTQAIWRRRPYGLIRNYDYLPGLCDALLLRSAWLGSPVLAMSDCVWGALDGMNTSGLAVSLSFGGRRVEGTGFGVTLVLRYILETCRNVAEGLAVLRKSLSIFPTISRWPTGKAAGVRWRLRLTARPRFARIPIPPTARASTVGQTRKTCTTVSAARSSLRPAWTTRSRPRQV